MLPGEAVRSRLASWLRPWLEEEPAMNLSLGFLRSNVRLRNLVFNPTALDALIERSTRLVVKRVRVGELCLCISPWSSPALTVEMSGINVTLAPREPSEQSRSTLANSAAMERKDLLGSIDPEGASLHDIIETISNTASSRNWFTAAMMDAVLRCFRIRFLDMHIQLEFANESFAWLLKTKELHLEPQLLDHSYLFSGLIGAFFLAGRESFLTVSCSSLEFGLKVNHRVNCIAFSKDLSTCIRLSNLQPLGLDIRIPLVEFEFSPVDLPAFLLLLDALPPEELKVVRNGRTLWKIAAQRIRYPTLLPSMTLHNLVKIAVLWIRYVHAYESLLLLAGYPNEKVFRLSAARASKDRDFLCQAKNKLMVVDEMEKELPIEAVARARRIARYQALKHSYSSEFESPIGIHISSIWKIFALLTPLWKVVYLLFRSVGHILLFLWSTLNLRGGTDTASSSLPAVAFRDSGSRHNLSVHLEQLHLTISPVSAAHASANGKEDRGMELPLLNLLSFCIAVKSFFLTRSSDSTEQSLFLALGEVKVHSCSSSRLSLMESGWGVETHTTFKGPGETSDDLQVILWSEPALLCHPLPGVNVDSVNSPDRARVFILENCLGQMWSDWKSFSENFGGNNSWHMEHPFVLCDLKSFFMNPCINRSDSGLWKCSLTLGKLNLDLEYSSIVSVALLFRQIQYYLHLTTSSGSAQVLAHSSSIVEERMNLKWEDQLELYTRGLKMAMVNIIPEKNIQVGAVIAGPSIRISLQREGLLAATEKDINRIIAQGNGDSLLTIDLENIELAVWPASKGILLTLNRVLGFNETAPEYLWLKEPRIPDIPKAQSNERFISQGRIAHNACLKLNNLTAFFEDSEENQLPHVIGPISMTVQSSACRDYLHSFSTNIDALSMAMSGSAMGASIISYIDELCFFFQVFEGMSSAAWLAFINSNSGAVVYPQEFIRRFMTPDGKTTKRNIWASEAEDKTLIFRSTQFIIDASFEFMSVDIVLNSSRKNHITGNSMKSNGASSSNYHSLLALRLPDFNMGVFLKKSCIQIVWEGRPVKVLIDLSGIQSVIFKDQTEMRICNNASEIKNLIYQSFNLLYEFSLSSCMFSLYAGSHGDALPSASISDAVEGPTSCKCTQSVSTEEPQLTIVCEGSGVQSWDSNQCQLHAVSTPMPALGCWILMNIGLGEIVMEEYCTKNLLTGAHQPKRLQLFLSISRELETVNCEIQGGSVFIETSTLAMFIQCFSAYSLWITSLPLWRYNSLEKQFPNSGTHMVIGESVARPSNHLGEEYAQGILCPDSSSEACKWRFPKALTINISQISLTAAVSDGRGGVQELIVEADTNLKLMGSGRKFLFDLSRLTILSQHLHKSSINQTRMTRTPHFHSNSLSNVSSNARSGLSESILPVLNDEHSTHTTVFQREISVESSVSGFSPLNYGSYILKHLAASIMVEKTVLGAEVGHLPLKNDWAGNGSISGFDLTITISEIQMLLNLAASFSGVSSVKAGHTSKQNFVSRNEGLINNPDYTIPDGAIVAIQDLHQHMYIAVEAVGRNYHLVGALHYSLVGERALFRVKYHNRKRWRSPVSCFSLTSLHAKNDAGEPLCLNCRLGSSFVDISSSDNRDWALWQTSPYKLDNYGDDDDLDSYMSNRKAFNLMNQKNDCAVAFVDGLPEFVKKPGNPFKAKVFQQHTLMRDVGRLDVPNPYTGSTCETKFQGDSYCVDEEKSGKPLNLPHVNITIDKITLTILHEVSDANDKFPLVRGYIDNVHIIEHIMPSKFRLISTFNVAVHCFDAQRNFWQEIISPVDACVFFRSKFMPQGSESVHQGVPVRFHFRMIQVEISLTELSLDILLFLVGKLDLAGPYAVRNSMIFANCCKVENRSGLSLLCHFADNQDAIVSGKQSASIFLRHIPFADQIPEKEMLVAVRLAEEGVFSTSPIQISLSIACVFAWRTRVVSLQDTRTFPGPFVVVEVSKNTEDGLSLVVSPLLRIHNESGFSMELRFRRPQETEAESASILLKSGDIIDDSTAVFDALDFSGGLKKALMSLSLGNFLLSFRPEMTEGFEKTGKPVSVDWSEDLKGGKAVRVSGIFDKLNYRFRKAFGVKSVKSFFSTIHCPLIVDGLHVSDIHFLIQTIGRDVPVMQPHNVGDTSLTKTSPVAFQVQKEIFIFPTVRVSNLLQTEILVVLTESHPDICMKNYENTGKQAIIPCGSSAYLYANPAIIYFAVTLTALSSSCKPVNSGDWVKKLHKQKSEVHYFDIELDFDGGKYFTVLRLSRGEKGILEATIYTPYTLQNNTELSLFCFASNQKPLSRAEYKKYISNLPPELGSFLPPKSVISWFLKSNKVRLRRLEEKSSEALLDLDLLSRFTELSLETQSEAGINHIAKLGVSLKPCVFEVPVPSQIVSIAPRYVISNESKETIIARQCYLEEDTDGIASIEGNQKVELHMRTSTSMRRGTSLFDLLLRKHRNETEDSLGFIQFCLKEIECTWSGPICIASLGRFFVKFKRPSISLGDQLHPVSESGNKMTQFAVVHIVEETSSLVLHFHMPPNCTLPYRIENRLRDVSITYYQKDLVEPEILGSGNSAEYVWDDLNLPHKLVVQIADMHLLREINIDKVCAWKPFPKTRHNKGMTSLLPLENSSGVLGRNYSESRGFEVFKLGYEVYADGLTRVLRICEFADSYKEEKLLRPSSSFQFGISHFAIHLLENGKKDEDPIDCPIYSTIIAARLTNITMDSVITEQYKHNCLRVQSINVDEKWEGAPFASMVRRSRLHDSSLNENILHMVFILHLTNSSVKQVKYSSIVLQPIDLNLDEETLMRLVPFWRTSLNDSKSQSQLFYFKHFEIHPIKIRASFIPGNPYSSYSSAQETLRTLLHSVIKVPTIKNTVVELNGVLLTHALVTLRELFIKSAQHYSWYIIRAVYIAKGSPLLPPAFASIFDDSASSSLDVFFDPSDGSISLPGLTLGMFKFISKCIDSKGFSGTKRYFGDLGKTMKKAGSNVLFAAITEISDNVLKGAEANGFNGLVNGFHQGILRLAMEPSLLGAAVMEGGPDRKIKLDRSPGVDELYIEGYLQAMLDVMYKQEYLRVRVIDNQVLLKNLPPNSSLINEIVEHVKSFLVSRALLNGETSTAYLPLRHLRGESEWRIGPTVLTLCEHLFVSFAIRMLRKQACKLIVNVRWSGKTESEGKGGASLPASSKESQEKPNRKWVLGKFVLSGMVAYVDGRLCRHIPNPIARRIVSGFLLSFLDKKDGE